MFQCEERLADHPAGRRDLHTVRVSGDIESTSNSGYQFMIAD